MNEMTREDVSTVRKNGRTKSIKEAQSPEMIRRMENARKIENGEEKKRLDPNRYYDNLESEYL